MSALAIIGPLHGDWWKLFSERVAYANGVYAFVALVAVAIFGWLVERRHGPAAVLALFLGAGATGALVASAVYSDPVVSGGNGAALALLAAWAAPDLESAARGPLLRGRSPGRHGDRRTAVGDPVRASGGQLAGGRHRRGAADWWSGSACSGSREAGARQERLIMRRAMTMTNAVVLIEAERDALSSSRRRACGHRRRRRGLLGDGGVGLRGDRAGARPRAACGRGNRSDRRSLGRRTRTQTMVAFAAYSRHDLEALFSIGE